MSQEHHSAPSERSEQAYAELEATRAGKLAERRATGTEQDRADRAEKRAESARETIQRQDLGPEPAAKTESENRPAPATAFLNHHLNYVQTLGSVQRKLTPLSRSFSKVIHTPAVEKVSEALEKTVARPSVLLGTTWTALIVGTIFYLTARRYGYALSGSELLFSFIVGAGIGLLLEGVWRTLHRR